MAFSSAFCCIIELRSCFSLIPVFNFQEELRKISKGKKPHKTAYARLLYKAAHALAEVSDYLNLQHFVIKICFSHILLLIIVIFRINTNLSSPKIYGWNPITLLLHHGNLVLINVFGNQVVNFLSF